MKHRFGRLATTIVGVALPIGLLGCSEQHDPASPETGVAPANGAVQAAGSSAVQDALTRLIPNLSQSFPAAGLEPALHELAAALADSNHAVIAVALSRARAAVDQYASASTADEADLEAIRLAIAAHAPTNRQ